MATLPPATDLFAEAAGAFRAALPEAERKALRLFQNKDDMLQQVKSACRTYKDTSRLLRCCSQVAAFANTFEPYYDVVNIFVQVKPEYMGIIWGSIRLIFQLGSNHVNFLEKVSDLFELLSTSLPRYRQQYETCRRRDLTQVDVSRVKEILSHVYADIISFCGQVCLIFCRRPKSHGFKQSLRLFRDTVWMPFDFRFQRLQERMQTSQDLFEKEMQLQDSELLTQHFEDVQDYLKEYKKGQDDKKLRQSAQKIHELDRKIDDLQQWIWNIDHKTIYEKALRTRYPGSCDWLLSKPKYQSWRDRSFETRSIRRQPDTQKGVFERLLFLYGKPGFGKTLLSTAVIEDLAYHTLPDPGHSTVRPSVAYFHFNHIAWQSCKSSVEALRALASQLIDQRRSEASVTDALLILFNKFSHDQRYASNIEVEAVLRLLIQNWPTFLVVDGVDECPDSNEFLTGMWSIISDLDCRILFLGRPELTFPRAFNSPAGRDESGQEFWMMQLSAADNFSGIQSYLSDRFELMAADNLFGNLPIEADDIKELTSRSNGMFLWAALLTKYLECPALSPLERVTLLRKANLIEGLDSLYCKILDTLNQRYDRQKSVAIDTFQWLSFSAYQLGSQELRYALAINPGRKMHNLDLLPNFPKCLQQITMSLVDIDPEGCVGFVHLSFKEFLESSPRCHPSFSLRDVKAICKRLSAKCLSHVVRDIPEQPLRPLERDISLEVGTTICGTEVRFEERLSPADHRSAMLRNNPFLRYASLFWVTHLVQSFLAKDVSNKQKQRMPLNTEQQDYQTATHEEHALAWNLPGNSNSQRLNSHNTPDHTNFERLGLADMHPSKIPRLAGPDVTPNEPTNHQQTSPPDIMMQLLSEFLLRRLKVTAWVEACWTFGWPPHLSQLEQHLQELVSDVPLETSQGRELHWILAGAHQLSQALMELYHRHYDKLYQNPTLIWQTHILTATDTTFWPTWKVETHDRLEEHQDPTMIPAGFHPQYDMTATSSNGAGLSLPMVR